MQSCLSENYGKLIIKKNIKIQDIHLLFIKVRTIIYP